MVLVVNNIVDATERRRFDEIVLPRLEPLAPSPFVVRRLLEPAPLDGGGRHDALLVSGSELSAARDNPRDDELLLFAAFFGAGEIGRALPAAGAVAAVG